MIFLVEGAKAYCYTGGRPLDPGLPAVVFIHGAQNDHSVWNQQARYFAHHGFNVLAVDLPGHGRSKGAAKASVEEMAGWLLALLDAAGVERALLVGHSMGSLVALEASYMAPARASGVAMLGATYPMKVSDALLATSRGNEPAAIDMVNIWSHSMRAQNRDCPSAGISAMGVSRRLMQRMSAINPNQLFHTDFAACNAYANGEAAARALQCPALFVFGGKDVMTPARSTKLLTSSAPHGKIVHVDAGHSLMSEQPCAVLDALFGFACASV